MIMLILQWLMKVKSIHAVNVNISIKRVIAHEMVQNF